MTTAEPEDGVAVEVEGDPIGTDDQTMAAGCVARLGHRVATWPDVGTKHRVLGDDGAALERDLMLLLRIDRGDGNERYSRDRRRDRPDRFHKSVHKSLPSAGPPGAVLRPG
ncbi:MAG: hypothetical protein LC733_04440 [Actinobacteria bacterium]|nr:hypothetical protein [Actinomycetota bacterium]